MAGSVHEATRRGLALANQAALRVCRQDVHVKGRRLL